MLPFDEVALPLPTWSPFHLYYLMLQRRKNVRLRIRVIRRLGEETQVRRKTLFMFYC